MPPLISIITPVYNCENFLTETFASLQNQSFKNFEHIVIDGGSTDKTVDLIKSNQAQVAYWISEKDNGMYNAINKGFRQAKGEILAYLNADDLYFPDTLQKVANAYQQEKFDLLYGNTEYMDEHGNKRFVYKNSAYSSKSIFSIKRIPFAQPAAFWSRELYNSLGGFDENYRLVADSKFFFQAFQTAKTIKFLPEQLAKFRLHKEALSSNSENMAVERRKLDKELGLQGKRSFAGTVEETKIKLLNWQAFINRLQGK